MLTHALVKIALQKAIDELPLPRLVDMALGIILSNDILTNFLADKLNAVMNHDDGK